MQRYTMCFATVLLASSRVMSTEEPAEKNPYLLKHVLDNDCRSIIKFIKVDDKGELVLGGLHIDYIRHEIVERVAAQVLQEPALQKRLNKIKRDESRAQSWYGSSLPDAVRDRIIRFLMPSEDELNEVHNFTMAIARSQFYDEEGQARQYPQYIAIGWNDFKKQNPELAQMVREDRMDRGVDFDRLNVRVRFSAGDTRIFKRYLKTASCRTDVRKSEPAPFLLDNRYCSRILVHKDAEKLFIEKLKEASDNAKLASSNGAS